MATKRRKNREKRNTRMIRRFIDSQRGRVGRMKGGNMKTNSINPNRSISWSCSMCVAGASALVIFVTELSAKASDSDSPPPVSISSASTGRIALVYGGTVPKFDLQVPDTKEEVAGDTARMLSLDWL